MGTSPFPTPAEKSPFIGYDGLTSWGIDVDLESALGSDDAVVVVVVQVGDVVAVDVVQPQLLQRDRHLRANQDKEELNLLFNGGERM